jgi:hypothetical protein
MVRVAYRFLSFPTVKFTNLCKADPTGNSISPNTGEFVIPVSQPEGGCLEGDGSAFLCRASINRFISEEEVSPKTFLPAVAKIAA